MFPLFLQLLIAFDALKSIGLVHADLKLDNVMLVNHIRKPFRVKLIDFGLSFKASEDMLGKNPQPRGYRSDQCANLILKHVCTCIVNDQAEIVSINTWWIWLYTQQLFWFLLLLTGHLKSAWASLSQRRSICGVLAACYLPSFSPITRFRSTASTRE